MKITGIVSEYNPFHSGHKYQISQISADAVVSIMSGSFVERGDTAIADKWTRAELAIRGGVDLVIEMPVVFALNTAQKFALGAVSLMDSMGIDEICFGSECGDIEALKNAACLIENEPQSVSEKIKKLVSDGMSYPSAREKAYSGLISENILSSPNNILAVEYLRAIMRLKSKITAVAVKRAGAGYNEIEANGEIASAAAIRQMIRDGRDVSQYTDFKGKMNDLSKLDSAVTAVLRTISRNKLAMINEVGEGLENRIIKAAAQYDTIDEIAETVKTKRYTMSRIRRILIASLLNLTADLSMIMPDYIRVLAMNKNGMAALREIKDRTSLPIITKTADYTGNSLLFQKDILATDIAALTESKNRQGGRDFTTSPIIF